MNSTERRLSHYIDALNAGQGPEKHYGPADTPELAKLLATARLVRTLREPSLPDRRYPERLAKAVAGVIQKNNSPSFNQAAKRNSKDCVQRVSGRLSDTIRTKI